MRQRAAFAIVFVSLAVTTAPGLWKLARRAWELRSLDFEQRRARVNGPMYASSTRLRSQWGAGVSPARTGEDAGAPPLALICEPNETDPALFLNYYLYPRRTRIYRGLDDYRNSANDPSRPRTIVSVRDSARLMTYEELRDEKLRGGRVMHGPLEPAPSLDFIVPLAGSLDGPLTDMYVIEADFAGDATVRMTLMPQRLTKTITIAPAASFYDLVYQNFGVMTSGWLRVESDRPLRAAVWLVNRGRSEGVAIPLVTEARSGTIRCPADECSLQLVNFSDAPATAHVNGTPVLVPASGIVTQPLRGEAKVDGPNIFAFAGTRGGKLAIGWPE